MEKRLRFVTYSASFTLPTFTTSMTPRDTSPGQFRSSPSAMAHRATKGEACLRGARIWCFRIKH